ncbi:hypothetical protein A33Q_2764 [Indibacter alkaliphilus LW1]|uniref:Uncharacterized protein n=1 Tax=Indibacter alkaliphilus (strain CCUG 57479 / KCTC 22604 / LW1) TaxID=1189612 RepID=S2DVS9_INDAL|nr:hypothetical protein [Indibacter alkaliphilus]EOZ96171.1 hypothetical protein A33Q_2764 [Indibacter alkaliphilus LW1]
MYLFDDHLHNFAVWTAARASQRNFTTLVNIKVAIEKTELRDFVNGFPKSLTQSNFDLFHRATALKLISELKELTDKKVTYGRVAKIISIYLKTSVIIPLKGEGQVCELIHPPIDSILLKTIYKETKDSFYKDVKWTELDFDNYWKLVSHLRSKFGFFNWKLESHWKAG